MNESISEYIDVVPTIIDIINQLCTNLFSSIDKEIFPILDTLVFVNDEILESGEKMNKLFSSSSDSGVLLLANSLLVSFILYYCARLLLCNLTGSVIESPPQFFLKVFLAGVAMNYSFSICTFLINTTDLISSFFLNLGENIFNCQVSFVSLISTLSENINTSTNFFSLNGILSRRLDSFIIYINNKFFS